jgi:hypothetical protein
MKETDFNLRMGQTVLEVRGRPTSRPASFADATAAKADRNQKRGSTRQRAVRQAIDTPHLHRGIVPSSVPPRHSPASLKQQAARRRLSIHGAGSAA